MMLLELDLVIRELEKLKGKEKSIQARLKLEDAIHSLQDYDNLKKHF